MCPGNSIITAETTLLCNCLATLAPPVSLPQYFISLLLCFKHKIMKHTWCCVRVCVCVLITQSCLTLWHPMDCSPPDSSVHGILQARILEWVAIPFSRRSSWPRNRTQVSCITGGFFTLWAIGEAPYMIIVLNYFQNFKDLVMEYMNSLMNTFLT